MKTNKNIETIKGDNTLNISVKYIFTKFRNYVFK